MNTRILAIPMPERSRGRLSYAPMQEPMPYKFNEPRRHKIPTAKYRVTNWPDYDAALVRRGALTVWFTDEGIAGWGAPATGRRGVTEPRAWHLHSRHQHLSLVVPLSSKSHSVTSRPR